MCFQDAANAACFTDDGSFLVCAHMDGKISIFPSVREVVVSSRAAAHIN